MTPPPVSVITPESDVVPPWAKTEIDERHTASANSASRCTKRLIGMILLPPGAEPRCLAHNSSPRPSRGQTAGRYFPGTSVRTSDSAAAPASDRWLAGALHEEASHILRAVDRGIEAVDVGAHLATRVAGNPRDTLGQRPDDLLLGVEIRDDGIDLLLAAARAAVQPIAHRLQHQPARGNGIRRVDQAGDVEVVGDRVQRLVGALDDLDVVERPDRIVGVADHVLEDHHRHQGVHLEVLELETLEFDSASLHPLRDISVVLEEHAEPRALALARDAVDVGDLREARAERPRRDDVEDPVGEILAEQVLLPLVAARALDDELQRLLLGERRRRGRFLRKRDPQRYVVAGALHAAEMAAPTQLDLQRRVTYRQRAREARDTLDVAVLVHGFEVRGQRDGQGLFRREE